MPVGLFFRPVEAPRRVLAEIAVRGEPGTPGTQSAHMGIDRPGRVSTLQVRSVTDQGDRGEISQRERLLFLLLIPGEKAQCGPPDSV